MRFFAPFHFALNDKCFCEVFCGNGLVWRLRRQTSPLPPILSQLIVIQSDAKNLPILTGQHWFELIKTSIS